LQVLCEQRSRWVIIDERDGQFNRGRHANENAAQSDANPVVLPQQDEQYWRKTIELEVVSQVPRPSHALKVDDLRLIVAIAE
jgi:hypothetical protein